MSDKRSFLKYYFKENGFIEIFYCPNEKRFKEFFSEGVENYNKEWWSRILNKLNNYAKEGWNDDELVVNFVYNDKTKTINSVTIEIKQDSLEFKYLISKDLNFLGLRGSKSFYLFPTNEKMKYHLKEFSKELALLESKKILPKTSSSIVLESTG